MGVWGVWGGGEGSDLGTGTVWWSQPRPQWARDLLSGLYFRVRI